MPPLVGTTIDAPRWIDCIEPRHEHIAGINGVAATGDDKAAPPQWRPSSYWPLNGGMRVAQTERRQLQASHMLCPTSSGVV